MSETSDIINAAIEREREEQRKTEPDYTSPENLSRRRIERMSGALNQLIDESGVADDEDYKILSQQVDEIHLGQLEDFVANIRSHRK